jgi:D-glycero-alpha-D-manno-heptose-7-phosphate kinase
MIITQTPLRISFFGGGTDFADFYEQEEGCVLSSAIDKYIFVIVKQRFDQLVRVGYTRTELVDNIEHLQHDLVREALQLTGVDSQIEVGTLADIPSSGSGLGSSSSVTVGVLNALQTYCNQPPTQELLARQACEIEIDRLGKPIGKQDQYIAAYGGFRFIRFLPGGDVQVESLVMSESERRRLNQHLMLFYTNHARQSETILDEQRNNINHRMDVLREMRAMAYQGKVLLECGDFESFGCLLDDAWRLKKSLASKISNERIDELYDTACRAGAMGGKITGAGGGGFLLLYCPRENQYHVRDALSSLRELPFHLESDGSKVIFNYRR